MNKKHLDQIKISDLLVRSVIGVNDWERDIKQDIRINMTLFVDISKAAQTDSIAHTVDYKALTKRVIDFVEESSFYLIEALIEKVAEIIFSEFGVAELILQMDKPHALRYSESVGVRIHRVRGYAE